MRISSKKTPVITWRFLFGVPFKRGKRNQKAQSDFVFAKDELKEMKF